MQSSHLHDLPLPNNHIRSVFGASKVINQSQMANFVFAFAISEFDIKQEHHSRNGQAHFHKCHAFADASTRSDAEWAECPAGDLYALLGC